MVNYIFRTVFFIGLALAASYLCVKPISLHAQTVSGTILGTVEDQQGAVIPNAEISTRNLETGQVRKTNADGSGNYRVSSVPAGTYEVSATASGFKTEVRSGVGVTVGGDISVNFALTVGAINEKVEVSEAAIQVDTSSSTLGGFVNSATIRELPLNGRDWLQLALLQPGVYMNTGQAQNDANRAQKGNGLAFSISGGRQSENGYRIDGLIVNDYANAGPGSSLRVNMGVDAIREFSVLTNNFSAEYGRGAGGVVNAITKSGTNEFHGSAFYFHRNSALDARNFFDGATIPAFHRHQAGGALGGPIKKDKTFFFTNYETLHEMKGLSYSFDTLSANAHNGILCANTQCTSTNTVTIANSVKPYLALFPLPNSTVTGNTGKFLLGAPRLGEEDYVIGKIDHNFSSATTLSGSYTYDDSSVNSSDYFDLRNVAAPTRRQNVILSLQHIFTPSVINTIRVGLSRTRAGNNIDTPINPALTDPTLGFLPNQRLGTIDIAGVSGKPSGVGALGINLFGHTAPQFYEDLSWTKGRHSLRTGFGFERVISNITSAQAPAGTWTFGTISGFLQGTPTQFAGDFPGTDTVRGQRNSVISGYVQDDYRVLSNLTLNLGVRYEMATVIKEVNGKLGNLRHMTDSTVTTGDPYWHNPTLKNFEPRVGFAWDPFKNGKTSVRGGFGMFDILPLPYLLGGRIVRSPPFFLQGNLANPPASSFPNQVAPLLNVSTLGATLMEFDHPARSYRMQWNLNIQRQLTRNLALTLGYVGSGGVHLADISDDSDQVPPSFVTFDAASDSFRFPTTGTIQKINPNFGKIRSTFWDGHSSYNSLQANLVERPLRGLTYQLAYTWSKSMDDGSVTYTGSESANTAGQSWFFCRSCNRGVSDFNIPHNFVANFLYDIPLPAAVKTHSVANTVLGGWQLGGIYTRQTGAPFTIRLSTDRARTGDSAATGANGAQKPMYVAAPGCNPDATTGNIGSLINTSCFAFPALGQLGNLGRNTLHMPTFRDLDFSVFKNQNVWGEKLKAQLRIEMFNVLNNTNLQAQLRSIFDGAGNILPTLEPPAFPTVNTSRQIQFGLRLVF
jgi:hypothetical protein